jgi:acyl-CoA reductase-like NAD-dependent aldehyde dehydrogenase
MTSYAMLIDGKPVSGAATMPVINPATGDAFAHAPRASVEQLSLAVAAAKRAFTGWAAIPIAERREAILACADAIAAHKGDLSRLLTQEQGKPLGEAEWEVDLMIGLFRYFASLDLQPELLADDDQRRVEAHPVPLGVVAAIVPWNFPLALLAFKLPAALLAGNTVVVKPAATTPLATLAIGHLIAPMLPAGVVNIITDANDLGDALTTHPDVAKISFTGSTATGKKVMAGAAEGLKRITLELGGNDPAFVLDDVNVAETAPKLFASAFANGGQVCVAIKRLYVHDAIYDEMCVALATLADQAVVGNGLEQGTQVGPIQNEAQYRRVLDLIEDGRQHGCVIAGGELVGDKGYFIRPTIVRDVKDGDRLVDEEQFGPVLPIIRYTDVDEVMARANASPFGLGASVWSSNADRAAKHALQVEAGTVWVNKHLDLAPDIPFGGTKTSGLGVELSAEGLREYTQRRIINIAKVA